MDLVAEVTNFFGYFVSKYVIDYRETYMDRILTNSKPQEGKISKSSDCLNY